VGVVVGGGGDMQNNINKTIIAVDSSQSQADEDHIKSRALRICVERVHFLLFIAAHFMRY